MTYAIAELNEFKRYLGIHENGDIVFSQCEPKEHIVASARTCIVTALCSPDRHLSSRCEIATENGDVVAAYEMLVLQAEAYEKGHPGLAARWAIYSLIEQGGLLAQIRSLPRRGLYYEGKTYYFPLEGLDQRNLVLHPDMVRGLEEWSPFKSAEGKELVVAPKPALREAWLKSLGAESLASKSNIQTTISVAAAPTSDATAGDAKEKQRRPAYERDRAWLAWHESSNSATSNSPAKIRNKWNRMTDHERQEIAPRLPEKIQDGKKGLQVVEAALKKARKERAARK